MKKMMVATTMLLALGSGALFTYVNTMPGVKRVECEHMVEYKQTKYCVDGMGIKNSADFERIDKLGETKVENTKQIRWVEK